MKLAKRISIALLAACVVGGSALAMTACGGGEPEPVISAPIVSEDPVSSDDEDVISDSSLSDDAIDTESQTSDSSRITIEIGTVETETENASEAESEAPAQKLDYSDAYLTAYTKQPFKPALKQAMDLQYGSDAHLDDYEIDWYSDWETLNQISVDEPEMRWLKDGEVPVSCSVSLHWNQIGENDPQDFHIYLGYNAEENTLRVVQLNIHYEKIWNTFHEESAYNTFLQYLRVLQ